VVSDQETIHVTAVVPHWNRRDLLDKLFPSLHAQTHPFREIIVVDNGSEDGSADLAVSLGARVIRFDRNRGFAVAVNEGVRASETKWVAILNNDVTLAADWLANLLAAAERRSAWFAAGLLTRAGSPDVVDGTWDLVCRGGCAYRMGSGRAITDHFRHERMIGSAPMTAALFRRDLFDKVGLLDEEFESYLEDVEFGLRCALGGYRGVYVPEARAEHAGSATLGRWNPDTVRRIARNQLLLIAKHYPPGWFLRYGWPVLVAQLGWGCLAARRGAAGAWVEGFGQGVRRLLRRHSESNAKLGEILVAGEREIEEYQKDSGYDLFWRLYLSLT
jgi:GT2 family glycosyltransferase